MAKATPDAVEFFVSYEGEALADSPMDVRDLAPALLALGQAFERANFLLNGDRASVSLQIRATRQGSFDILLFLQQLLEGASAVLSTDFLSTAANLKSLLIGGSGAVSLIGLIRHLRGSKPKQVGETDGTITLEIDGVKLSIPAKVLELYRDRVLKDQLEAVVLPLLKSGIDRVAFRDGATPNQTAEVIEKEDAKYFQSGQDDNLSISEFMIPRQRLKIESLNFRKGKWKLSDGEHARWYTIRDGEFAGEVEKGLRRFGSGDFLICQVVMNQQVDAQGNLKLKYEIADVLKHILPGEQLRMLQDTDGHAGGDAL